MQGPEGKSTNEEELLASAVGGDCAALTALLRRHAAAIRRSLSISPQWQAVLDVDDVLQVTYLEVFLRIGEFRPQGALAFLAWLRQIARNNLRDAIRGLQRDKRPPASRQVVPPQGDDSYVALYELVGATSATPSRAAMRQEARTALEVALAALPSDYAQVVQLYDLEGRSGSEVAAAMGRSRGAVVLLRMRAHDRLKQRLGSMSRFVSR